jgi:hypothetical protein
MSLLEVKQTSRGSVSAGRTIKPRSLIALPRDPTIGLTQWAEAMGYNQRNDEIRENIERMRSDWEAQRDALATVRRFNARLSAKGYSWFLPKIAAALVSKHHWLVVACDACDRVVDLDLRVKPRDPEASIRVALRDVQCPRCNGHGRPRIIGLAPQPSV